jgi:hypothetical protein
MMGARHDLSPFPSPAAQAHTSTEGITDAMIDAAVLRCALEHFNLYVADALTVEHRYQLPPARQHALGLRSAPTEAERDMAAIAIRLRYCDQSGFVAPLWNDGRRMRINTPVAGLIMPAVRGGHVRALLHYADAYDDAPKWVTSARFPLGCKARPSIHVANPEYARRKGVAIIAAHALEAEAIAGGVMSVAGINGVRPDALVLQLREEWPQLRAVDVCTEEPMPGIVRALRLAGLTVTEDGDEQ